MKILEGLEQDPKKNGKPGLHSSRLFGLGVFNHRRKKERAIAWLEKAYQQHDPALANLKVDPAFDPLRQGSRFVDLMKKVGFGS
jgi:hypothetical protein